MKIWTIKEFLIYTSPTYYFLKNMSFQQQLGHLYDPFSLQGSGNTTEEEVERKIRSQTLIQGGLEQKNIF